MLINTLQESWKVKRKKIFSRKCAYTTLLSRRICSRLVFFLILNFVAVLCFSSSSWAIRATAGDKQIQISWIAPTQNEDGSLLTDLAGYNIFRGLTREDQKEKINQELISGCSYVDSGLTNGQTYYYVVTAVDFSGNESLFSELVYATPTILPPAGFTARGDDGRVTLFWEKSESPEVLGYHLYRTLSPGRDYEKITDVRIDVEITTFEDMAVHNGINYYYIITSHSQEQESPHSEERAATPITPIPAEPSSLKAIYTMGKVELEWSPDPNPDPNDPKVTGYHVYRRNSLEEKQFQKLTNKAIAGITYEDDSIEENTQYFYSVVGVYPNGVESTFPLEVVCYTKTLYIASITDDSGGKARKAGDLITIIITGEPGCYASFDITGLTMNQPMEEIKPGVYHSEYIVPKGGRDLAEAELIGYLSDADGHKTKREAFRKIYIKNTRPPSLAISVTYSERFGWPQINWDTNAEALSEEASFSFIELFRATSAAETDLLKESAVRLKKSMAPYVDQKAEAGAKYYYAARIVDEAGNRSELSQSVFIDLSQKSEGPRIDSVTDDTLGIPVKTGQIIRVTAKGDWGCEAFFSIEKIEKEESLVIIQNCPLEEIRSGMYQGQYRVKSSDQTEEKGATLIAQFVDRAERKTSACSQRPVRINVQSDDHEPPTIKDIEHNGSRIVGISGKLVAGDLFYVRLFGEPGGIAFFTLGQNGPKISMEETLISKEYRGEYYKEYQGTYTIRVGDDGEEIAIYGYLTDQAGNTAHIKSDENELITIDTRPIINVVPDQKVLLANNESKTEVLVQAEDVNGHPIIGHYLALTLSTTDEYTDVIGGGDFGEKEKIDGKLAIDFEGITDDFGEVKAEYTVGNAAKTALIVAKDLNTGYAGAGYITTFIESSLPIILDEPKQQARFSGACGEEAVFMILKTQYDKLTADGRSRSRVSVELRNGCNNLVTKPYKVTFLLDDYQKGHFEDPRGRREPNIITRGGKGYAYFVAGKHICTAWIGASAAMVEDQTKRVMIRADEDNDDRIPIILMSDAPAEIDWDPNSAHLIAGRGELDFSLTVTDINKNPNPEYTVQLRLADGKGASSTNGDLADTILYTDRNGKAESTYTAGSEPGTVQIMAKVTSRIPTKEELLRAQGNLFVPLWSDEESNSFGALWGDEIPDDEIGTLQEWLKNKGDEIQRGELVAHIVTEDHGDIWVKAPYTGELSDIKVMAGEEVRIGQTIGIMNIEEEELEIE